MIVGLLVFAAITVALLHIGGVFWLAGKVQDWAYAHSYPDVLLPWLFSMTLGIALPIGIAVAVAVELSA